MLLNFAEVIAAVRARGGNYRMANAARGPQDYALLAVFPEVRRASFTANSAAMRIITTMAGLVGADSPYPPGGLVEQSDFSEQLLKIGIEVPLPEMTLRELLMLVTTLQANGGNTNDVLVRTVLNFTDKVLVQAMTDTEEYLRGSVLTLGKIDWTMNKKRTLVEYNLPAGALQATRTIAGGTAYHLPGSTFWADSRAMGSRFNNRVRARMGHGDTIAAIIDNPAHNIAVVEMDEARGIYDIRRIVDTGTGRTSDDARERLRLIAYSAEGEVLNPALPGQTIKVPFLSRGKLAVIGTPSRTTFEVGAAAEGLGATPTAGTAEANAGVALGVTHIGPTIENGGVPGRYVETLVPQDAPWSLRGRAAENVMVILDAYDQLGVMSTEMAA